MNTPDCAILGMGYLGKALAEKLFEQGSSVSAVKKTLTSDDINLPVSLNTVDLNDETVFQTALWTTWADKPVWICLLPPSSVVHYAEMLEKWLALAAQYGVKHVIYSSSTSVYGDAARVCDEHSALDPQTDSAKKVLAAEQVFLNSGIPHIDILRFGGLYSVDRHPLNSLLRRGGIKNGGQPVNIVHKDFAVAALHLAACTPDGVRIRNIVEPRHPSKQDFYGEEAAKLGLPAPDCESAELGSGKIVNTAYDDFAAVFA